MKHIFTEPDLIALDNIWPLGQRLDVSDGGTIVVAGAYEGRYIHYLNEMFPAAHIVGYEPQYDPFIKSCERFNSNKQVEIRNYGLTTCERDTELGLAGTDGASAVCFRGQNEMVHMANIVEELQIQAHEIDLFVINMEGSEWAVVPYVLDEMMHHRIKSMAVQFHHDYVSVGRAARVKNYLREYYDLDYEDTNNWTLWKRK
jgi:hypothetical protein